MQSIETQSDIATLSTGALEALIRECEAELCRYDSAPARRQNFAKILQLAKAELSRRRMRCAPKPPGFY